MTPSDAYRRLNKIIWYGRLPKAKVLRVPDATIPRCHGLTLMHDAEILIHPVILLNITTRQWGRTLIHEMLHVAEPQLLHGELFETIVNRYWRLARLNLKDIK